MYNETPPKRMKKNKKKKAKEPTSFNPSYDDSNKCEQETIRLRLIEENAHNFIRAIDLLPTHYGVRRLFLGIPSYQELKDSLNIN